MDKIFSDSVDVSFQRTEGKHQRCVQVSSLRSIIVCVARLLQEPAADLGEDGARFVAAAGIAQQAGEAGGRAEFSGLRRATSIASRKHCAAAGAALWLPIKSNSPFIDSVEPLRSAKRSVTILRSPASVGGSSSATKRRGALAAEIEFRGIFERAIEASQAERRSTLPAELHTGWIVKFALRAAHRQSLEFLRPMREYRRNTEQKKTP
jgi:hypothetical protein